MKLVSICLVVIALPGALTVGSDFAHLPHVPIFIQGDAGFRLPPEVSGVIGGSGSEQDPYIIGGWDIIPVIAGISLENTRAHVVIRDDVIHDGRVAPHACALSDTALSTCLPDAVCNVAASVDGCPVFRAVGIRLANVTNVTLERDDITGTARGIAVLGSNGVQIAEARISYQRNGGLGHGALLAIDGVAKTLQDLQDGFGVNVASFKDTEATGLSVLRSTVVLHQSLIEGFNQTLGAGSMSPVGVLVTEGSSLEMQNSVLRNNLYGVASFDSGLRLAGNTFDNNGMLYFGDGTAAEVEGNALSSRFVYICGEGTAVNLRGNVLVDSLVFSTADSVPCTNADLSTVVTGNQFHGRGGLVMESRGRVEDNTFQSGFLFSTSNRTTALEVVGYPVQVRGNRVWASDIAVVSQDSASSFHANNITGNALGFVALGQTKPEFHENAITNQAGYALLNSDADLFSDALPPASIPLDARLNWWGSAQGPSSGVANGVFGAALTEPWLAIPP